MQKLHLSRNLVDLQLRVYYSSTIDYYIQRKPFTIDTGYRIKNSYDIGQVRV